MMGLLHDWRQSLSCREGDGLDNNGFDLEACQTPEAGLTSTPVVPALHSGDDCDTELFASPVPSVEDFLGC
jgi:hypothetical protein